MRKKVKVVMTPTNSVNQIDQGDLFINDTREHSWGKLEALTCERVTVNGHAWNGSGIRTNINHLYFISDEELKDGEWCYESKMKGNKIFEYDSSNIWHKGAYKVVATTDKSLVYLTNNGRVGYKLPQISQEFIENYCEVGGVDEVEIEYYKYAEELNGTSLIPRDLYRIKVDSSNCVFVHPVKDSWNREELITTVIDLFLKEREHREKYSHFIDREDLTEWINKNL